MVVLKNAKKKSGKAKPKVTKGPVLKLKLPTRYKKKDVLKIAKLLETKSATEVIKMYKTTVDGFKNDVTIFRKLGYFIPRVTYKGEKIIRAKRLPKPAPKTLKTKEVDSTLMKWVRIDKRTLIQVPIGLNETTAIEQHFAKREAFKNFVYRY